MRWAVAHSFPRIVLIVTLVVALTRVGCPPGVAQVSSLTHASPISHDTSASLSDPVARRSANAGSIKSAAETPDRLSDLPADAQGPISAAIGKDNSAYWARRSPKGYRAENPQQALAAQFTVQGTEVSAQNLRWGLQTIGWGYGDKMRALAAVAPRKQANRVEYRRNALTEWYENGPLGLEQGFTLAHCPGKANGRALTVEMKLRSDSAPVLEPDKKTVRLGSENGKLALHYTGLKATDATGRELRSWLDLRGQHVLVRVDDEGARYPLTIDPWIWVQQAELTAADGGPTDQFGYSVAVSGSTAVVGAYHHTVGSNLAQGVAYVFTESGGTWSQQAELTANDGAASDAFGYSVAVDGSTILVGSWNHMVGSNASQGAAYVFVDSGGTWIQQAELTASDGAANDWFGHSVALSGGTAVVSAIYHEVGSNPNQGAVYVFGETGGTWSQQAELTVSDNSIGWFGFSIAVSGNTVVVGVPGHQVGSNPYQGIAYVFSESGGTWSQQAELTASDGAEGDYFGNFVAVDGSTAVVGAISHKVGPNTGQGSAYVFVANSGTWSQQAELTSSDGAGYDGFGSVAINGSTIVVGAPNHNPHGAAYVFSESGGVWSQQAELTGADSLTGDYFGSPVALSGSTALVGASNHTVRPSSAQGAAYVFVPASPNYTLSASPNFLSVQQGSQGMSTVTITPTNGFSDAVSFSTSGLPSGVTASFDPNPATNTSTLTLTASPTAATGFATVTVTGTSGSLTQITTLTLLVPVPPSYTLYASPSNLTLMEAGRATSAISITALGGFNGSVSLTASGLPGGVTAAFSPNPATSASTLTLKASATATLGTTTVTLTGTSAALVQTIPLTLTVTPSAPAATLSPASLNFGNQAINTTSAAKSVTLKNSGTAPLNFTSVTLSLATNFSISNNTCGTTLAAGKTCQVALIFAPTQMGAATDTLSFTDDASGSPQTVPLSGTGIADATLTPANFTYSAQKVGTTGAAKTFTLTNNQPVDLTGIAVSTTGDFAVSATTCGTSLTAKSKCTVDVTFTPTATGLRTGRLSVSDSAGNSPQTSNLKGNGK